MLSAFFTDIDGRHTLAIEQNEWRTPTDNWDVEVEGRRITIRKKLGRIALRLRSDPPHMLTVERLDMYYEGIHLSVQENGALQVTLPSGASFDFGSAVIRQCAAAIYVSSRGEIKFGKGCKDIHVSSLSIVRPRRRP